MYIGGILVMNRDLSQVYLNKVRITKSDRELKGDITMARATYQIIFIGLLFIEMLHPNAYGKNLDTIDSTKIKEYGIASFVEHMLFWPDNKLIQEKGISTKQIPEDIDRLKKLLRQILTKEYRPKDEIVDVNSIAIENCCGLNDDIFLEYYPKKDILIQIQDLGKALLVSEFPQNDIAFEEDIGSFVEKKAKLLLQVDKDKDYKLFVSSLDIGRSKVGDITWDPNYPYSDLWYAHIKWWSDGKNVSFLISTSTFEPGWSKESMMKRASIGKPSPRKFKKRKDDQ